MKISKSYLKQIILEEINLLSEVDLKAIQGGGEGSGKATGNLFDVSDEPIEFTNIKKLSTEKKKKWGEIGKMAFEIADKYVRISSEQDRKAYLQKFIKSFPIDQWPNEIINKLEPLANNIDILLIIFKQAGIRNYIAFANHAYLKRKKSRGEKERSELNRDVYTQGDRN